MVKQDGILFVEEGVLGENSLWWYINSGVFLDGAFREHLARYM